MSPSKTHPEFFADAERVVTPLCEALRELLDPSEAGGGVKPRRAIAINPTLRSRVTRAIESNHLPSRLYFLPGPTGLRELVKAAQQTGTGPQDVERTLARIDAYESLLRVENMSRDALHAMVGDLAPEAHASVVRTNGQAVHKAMANLIGYSAEVMLTSLILLPGREPGLCELAQVSGFDRLQRHRTGAWFMTSGYGTTDGQAAMPRTLDGRPAAGRGPETLLTAYCSSPTPAFESTHTGRRHVYRLAEQEVAIRSACSFYFAERVSDAYPDPPAPASNGGGLAMASVIIATPARHLHFDVLVHKDLWRGASVSMATFRTVPHGPVDEQRIEERATDQIDLGVRAHASELSPGALNAPKLRRYAPMMRDVLDRLGVSADDFRLHRCEAAYPLYGTQYAMCFRTP